MIPDHFHSADAHAPDLPAGTDLVAGPAAPSPPFFIALAVVALSIAGPFVFLRYGMPSLLLGIAALAVALAGVLTLLGAVRAQLRRLADPATRRRASIGLSGITLHPTPLTAGDLHFPWADIEQAQLMPAALIVHVAAFAPRPGRHAVRFGKLTTPRTHIIAALDHKGGAARELT